MHYLFASIALSLAHGVTAIVSTAEAAESETPPVAVHVNRAEFLSRLPTRAYVYVDEKTRSSGGLKSIASADIRSLPDGATPARAVSKQSPFYPSEMRRTAVEGEARFLLLIVGGKIEAMYCYERTNQLFEDAAAEALSAWVYTSGRVNKAEVPMIVEQTIHFTLAK